MPDAPHALRIAWAGPWNMRSAITEFGLALAAELAAAGHSMEIIRTETGPAARLPPRPASLRVHPPGVVPSLAAFDALLVNLGNHYPYHGRAPALLAAHPATAILHDADMADFAAGWQADPEPAPLAHLRHATPLAPALAALACAAVVHGPHQLAEIEAACPGPVLKLPLAYDPPVPAPPRPIGPRLAIATIGHVNPNKRAGQVIRALGGSPILAAHARYTLIGPVAPSEQDRLLRVAAAFGAPAPEFTGWLPDAAMLDRLAGTDVMACLRHPATEGGSASLVLALRSARPTLVSDTASYAEIPDDLVLRCPAGAEAPFILRHLEWVLDNPDAARRMGEAAACYARAVHSPAAYVRALLPFLVEATRAAPALLAARTLGLAAARLGLPPGDPVPRSFLATLAELTQ